jgi:hypothetical protein
MKRENYNGTSVLVLPDLDFPMMLKINLRGFRALFDERDRLATQNGAPKNDSGV